MSYFDDDVPSISTMFSNVSGIFAFMISMGVICLLATLIIFSIQLYRHLRVNLDTAMDLRRTTVIYIISFIPVFAILVGLSLVCVRSLIIFDTLRHTYEGVMLYHFLKLMIGFFGGAGQLELALANSTPRQVWKAFPLCCGSCLPKASVITMKNVKTMEMGAFQMVILKPTLGIILIIMYLQGLSAEGYSPSFVLITILNTLSTLLAMYSLLVMYKNSRHLIQDYRPLSKFLILKVGLILSIIQLIIIFFVNQPLIFELLVKCKVIDADNTLYPPKILAIMLSNWVLLLELPLFALAIHYAYPLSDYNLGHIELNGKDEVFSKQIDE